MTLQRDESQAASAALPYYLSLGDSYSIGYQPGIGGTPGFTGYIAGQLHMQAENFGCGGATTTSMLDSNGCGDPASQDAVPYSDTQEQAALGFIAAHPGAVSLITISIGGNDFDGCSIASCVQAAMPTMEANIKTIVSSLAAGLASASDPKARVIGLTYPDVDLGYYVYPSNPPTPASVSSAQSSITAFDDLINPTLSQAYLSVPVGHFVNVTSAPFGSATEGDDTALSSTEQVPPYGMQPDAVGEICQLTYFCSEGNIHANSAGYTFIGQLVVSEYESLNPPSTAVLIPSNGTALSGSTYLDASASDIVAVAKVQFVLTGGSLDQSVVGTAVPTLYGYLAAFNTTNVANGVYTLQSVAYDAAGNAGFSPGVTVTVVNPPPSTAVLIPSNGTALSGSTYLDASASDIVAVAKVQFVLTGGSLDQSVVGTAVPTLYGYLAAFNTTNVANGVYTLQSVAYDAAGNAGFSPGVTVTVVNPPPSTAVLIPSNGTALSGSTYLDASASDIVAVAKVQFVLTGGSLDQSVVGTAVPTLYGYLAAFNTTNVANGVYTLQSVAYDAAGNTGFSPGISVTIQN